LAGLLLEFFQSQKRVLSSAYSSDLLGSKVDQGWRNYSADCQSHGKRNPKSTLRLVVEPSPVEAQEGSLMLLNYLYKLNCLINSLKTS